MEDKRDSIDRLNAMTTLTNGQPESLSDLSSRFAACDVQRRADALDSLDMDMQRDNLSLSKRAEILTYRRRLGDVHEALRKAGR